MTKRNNIIVNVRPGESSDRWDNSTPENYENIIWDSITAYNWQAQIDIAKLLYSELKKFPETSLSNPYPQNLAFRIFQLVIEALDQYALICLSILKKSQADVFVTYLETNNSATAAFFNEALSGNIDEQEIKRIWGLEQLENADIKTVKAREKIKSVVEESVKTEKENLQKVSNMWLNTVKSSNAVKHGYKRINPSEYSKKVWEFTDDEAMVMVNIVNLTRSDTGEKKSAIKESSLSGTNGENIVSASEIFINMISFTADSIEAISRIQKLIPNDPFYVLGVLAKGGVVKIGRNESCPCNSGKKFKRCHYL